MKKFTKVLVAAVLILSCQSTHSFAQALNFGAYSFVDLNNDILPNNQSYTKEAWVRIYTYHTTHGCNILSAWDHPFWLENGVLSAANGYGNTSVITVQDDSVLPTNKWIHVAVTYDAASTTMKLYKNGVLIATNTSAPSYITTDLQIGAQESGDFFDGGDIDEVRLWNVARTQSQILAAMNCDVPQQTNLVAYYRFDQGVAGATNTNMISAFDYSGNANCGTLQNFNLTGSTSNYITGAISSCNKIAVVTSAPGSITGASAICQGSTVALSDSVSGGLWSVDDIDTAAVSATGAVTGYYAGTVNISYKTCGGTATKTVTVNASPNISATASTGSITASTTGGASPYVYLWSNKSTSAVQSGLSTGTYSVTVTDANGCKDTGSYFVTGSVILTNSISITAPSTVYTGGDNHVIYLGYGSQSLTLTANPTGATSFSYSWTPGTYLNNTWSKSVTFTPAKAGVYTYTCTATNSGHSVSATVTITVIDAVDHSHWGNILTCHVSTCNHGIGNTKSVKCANVASQLCNNHSDYLGCSGSRRQSEAVDTRGMTIVPADIAVKTYPNPFNDGININIDGNAAEYADVIVYDLSGRVVESKQNQPTGTDIVIGNNLVSGVYLLEVRKDGMSKQMKIVKTK